MSETCGINHLGLTVLDLDTTTRFFTDCLGWSELARDETYPRTTVSDGTARFTLWQADRALDTVEFDRRQNIGLHHVALEVESEEQLNALGNKVSTWPGVVVEFMPEPLGGGPRKHMMFAEPGGLRIELNWPATG